MAEINTPTNKWGKKPFSRSHHRRSTRVDLTAMVDLGFLLISFFVFTTAMSTPKVMDLDETKDGPPKPVKLSGAMTILIGKDHQIFYYYGMLDSLLAQKQIIKTNFKEVRSLILRKKEVTELSYLLYIIKADKNSTFGDEINLVDEMSICNIPPGHYAEVDLTKIEEGSINSGE